MYSIALTRSGRGFRLVVLWDNPSCCSQRSDLSQFAYQHCEQPKLLEAPNSNRKCVEAMDRGSTGSRLLQHGGSKYRGDATETGYPDHQAGRRQIDGEQYFAAGATVT